LRGVAKIKVCFIKMIEKRENTEKKNCPICGSKKIIKKGVRKNKLKELAVFFCKDCQKKFTDSKFRFKTYNISQIVKALSFYNKGFTIKETSEKLDIPSSTISNWIVEHKSSFEMLGYATEIRKFKKNSKIIQTHKYEHGIIYLYQQHNFKILNLTTAPFKGLFDYLKLVSTGRINKDIFLSCTSRASDIKINIEDIKVKRFQNISCELAKMALELAKNNRSRHWAVEKTLLENDAATIAVEIPVYINAKKTNMPFLKNKAKDDQYIIGHIDILQIKNNEIIILDYKPDAAKVKPIGQLFVYACCLSRLTGLHFSRIKLAWFDENDYFEVETMDVYKKVMKIFAH
jgi:transposase-like protein